MLAEKKQCIDLNGVHSFFVAGIQQPSLKVDGWTNIPVVYLRQEAFSLIVQLNY